MKKTEKNKPSLTSLKSLIKKIDENKQPIAKKLFARANFMEKNLILLEKTIKNEGAVIELKNGNGFTTLSEHPAQKTYNTMVGKYNAVLKTILDLIPVGDDDEDDLKRFLRNKK